MKTAAKIFIILDMVFLCWLILPLIFGGIALSSMSKAQSKSETTVAAVLAILFCSIIGGILMLCVPEAEYGRSSAPQIEQPVHDAQ